MSYDLKRWREEALERAEQQEALEAMPWWRPGQDDCLHDGYLTGAEWRDLERVVLRCLAKRPEDRFQDAEGLERALSGCASADRWTQSDAARWWREHGQAATATREMSAAATA